MTTRERSDRHPRMMRLLPSLAHSRGVDPKSSPFDPDFHVFFGSRDENLAEHFRGKGDSVSWGIAESIKKYEEDTKKKVSRGADIASLYDQETECELAKEVENRINKALSEIRAKSCTAAARGADENKSKPDVQEALKLAIHAFRI